MGSCQGWGWGGGAEVSVALRDSRDATLVADREDLARSCPPDVKAFRKDMEESMARLRTEAGFLPDCLDQPVPMLCIEGPAHKQCSSRSCFKASIVSGAILGPAVHLPFLARQ